MYFAPGEHNPPHFHSYYNEFQGRVDIRSCDLMDGDLPTRQRKLPLAWAELHQEEWMANWNLVMNGETSFKIEPLR